MPHINKENREHFSEKILNFLINCYSAEIEGVHTNQAVEDLHSEPFKNA